MLDLAAALWGGAGLDPIARSESCSLEAAEVELVGSNICVGQTVFVLSLIKTAGLEPLLLLHLITAAQCSRCLRRPPLLEYGIGKL